MALSDFTGADLRDWHRDHFTEVEHASMCAFLQQESSMLSWELVARGVRDAYSPEILAEMISAPVVLEVVLQAFIIGFAQGAGATNRLWREHFEEHAA